MTIGKMELNTPRGLVIFEGPVTDRYIAGLTMNEGLTNFRQPEQQQKALMTITNLPDGMIFLARHKQEIIAYVTFHHPDEFSRWSKHPRVLEMGGIEVSPSWRGCRIGENLLKLAFSHPRVEDFIVITTEYCWHWDMKRTGLDVWAYQKMLTKLFGRVGLQKVTTDDPDILEHPANVLMARTGKNVGKEDILLFEEMRFMGKFGRAVNMS
ncbi:MAG: GNAT family N-acetyltransferase [Thermoanaerobacteraceae bacterium]|nr:GNAT family N-acetyltransferase [Thermoanaerobacteraceae bacterium]